jgi:hypothetical protein
MTMRNKLTSLAAAVGKPELEDDIIESPLQQDQQVCSRITFKPIGFSKVLPELPLEHSVDPLCFLFLTQTYSVLGRSPTTEAMHSRRISTLGDGALRSMTAGTFQEEAIAVTPT